MNISEKQIFVSNEIDIAVARHMGRDLADLLGFDLIGKHCIMTSISELASNIYFHVGQGTIILRVVNRDGFMGIEVIAEDTGPGIQDIEYALQDGTSTRGGLGGGLPGVGRLMSEMHIASRVGEGTVVRAVKWMRDPSSPVMLALSK